MRWSVSVLAVAASLLVPTITSCGGSSPDDSDQRTATTTLSVQAAASLTEAFGVLGKEFEAAHPGVRVKINYAGSATLVQQIINGAPADVFASADQKNMDKVASANLVDGRPIVFATNRLEIAVPQGNPKGIRSLADLAKPGVTVVACAPAVPCGSATKDVLRASGVQLAPASEEDDVKSVLNKVGAGEADAGLVYVTDVNSAKNKVTGVPFPEADKAVNSYPITVLADAPHRDIAGQFVDFVRGSVGRQELTKVGFQVP
jgi:molybdate transport system substrate-binding protein